MSGTWWCRVVDFISKYRLLRILLSPVLTCIKLGRQTLLAEGDDACSIWCLLLGPRLP